MSLFITFEGGEGCGKSTQARALHRRLMRGGRDALLLHEPGGTSLGKSISHWLKWRKGVGATPLAELLLFNASRANLVAEVIRPALRQERVVICDRFVDSTIAYQGYGRGLDLNTVKSVCHTATEGLGPDLTFLLDISVEEGLARKDRMRSGRDRFEQEDLAFHRRVRDAYLAMAKEEPERWLVLDARLPRAELGLQIWERTQKLLTVT